jgi:hypothetical protein
MPAPTFLDLAASIDNELKRNIRYPSRDIVFVDSPFAASILDKYVNANATGGNMVVTLPDATTCKGMPFGVKKTDASTNTVTIQSAGGGQTIDGVASKVLVNQNDFIVAVSDGVNYKIYAIDIGAAATSGAVFYTIDKILKTDGVSALLPIPGTTINFTVAVDGNCTFMASGYFAGTSGLIEGTLYFRIDGVDYIPGGSFFCINGAGGDRTGPISASPSISLFLSAGPHTVELRATQTNLALQASATNPLTLAVIYPGASANVASPTPKAATLVVDPVPGIGDYTTIQAALTAIGVIGGGYILIREGTYPEKLTFPLNAPIVMRGCGDSTIIAPVGAGEVFAFPNGQAALTYVVLEDAKITGDPTVAQTAFAYKDVNSRWRFITNRVHITGVRKIDDIQARQTTYVGELFQVDHWSPRFIPTTSTGNNVLCATPNAAGTYNGPTAIVYHDAILSDEMNNTTDGWHYDFDGDTIFEGLGYIQLESSSTVDGHEVNGSLISYAAAALTLEILGGSWPSFDSIQNQTNIGPFKLKLSGGFDGNVSHLLINGAGSGVILNRRGQKVDVSQGASVPAVTGVVVDVLAGADDCRVSGSFKDAGVASIRTAALKTVVDGCDFSQVSGKTVLETGAADQTVIDSCTGLGTGTGLTIIGPLTKVNGAMKSDKATSTTNALVEIVPTITNPLGLIGIGTIQNTDGVNSLDVKESFTDAFGTTSSVTTTVLFGNYLILHLQQSLGTGRAPYVSYKAEVIDTVPGSHATYVSHFTSQGAL